MFQDFVVSNIKDSLTGDAFLHNQRINPKEEKLVDNLIALIDAQREQQGFLSIRELLELPGNRVLDPFSVLVSRDVSLGKNNIFYPNVILETQHGGKISIGRENIFYPGTLLLADSGNITIGNQNRFGDGGVRIKTTQPTETVTIRHQGRYLNGAQIIGNCRLGSGSQILGPITVENCTLMDGGSSAEPDPDRRAGVLKGFGRAQNITVHQGEVINGQGAFDPSQIERQVVYHPKPSPSAS